MQQGQLPNLSKGDGCVGGAGIAMICSMLYMMGTDVSAGVEVMLGFDLLTSVGSDNI